jgi:hypothetical protein
MTDEELKQAMRLISKVTGLNLTDERIETDLPNYKRQLASIEKIATVKIPMEVEPGPLFRVKR